MRLRLPLAAVIRVPPTRNTIADKMMVHLRPHFSAIGKVQSAPKKQPACESQCPWRRDDEVITHLERRNDVALDGVSSGRCHLIQSEVTTEGVQSHGSSDDSGVIAHYTAELASSIKADRFVSTY